MKNFLIGIVILLIVIVIVFRTCRGKDTSAEFEPVISGSFASDALAEPLFRQDEILVFFNESPSQSRIDAVREGLAQRGITDSITVRKCNACPGYVELWAAEGIHNAISGEGVVGGSGGGGSHGVGEDSIASYSLNFYIRPPVEGRELQSAKEILAQSRGDQAGGNETPSDTILVAVLDTGIDTTNLIDPRYIWSNPGESAGTGDGDGNCYAGDRKGWNFVAGNTNISDDHPNLHGTLVTRYIIDAFSNQSSNFIQILPLKTHDESGYGDLFNTICALHYAADKGAQIINASWGFYFYDKDPHPYLTRLITRELRDKGILFIAAAGNRMDDADAYAKDLYQSTHGNVFPDTLLRNLAYHRFYPAALGGSVNNVLVVTTNDTDNVSPTQNFNSSFVSIGVMADTVMPGFMKFKLPFRNATGYVSGSSFATAILTGAVAAHVPESEFKAGINGSDVVNWLEESSASAIIPIGISRAAALDSRNRIEEGRYLERIE